MFFMVKPPRTVKPPGLAGAPGGPPLPVPPLPRCEAEDSRLKGHGELNGGVRLETTLR